MLSGAVKVEDLNDFILPSQNCIVPILQNNTRPPAKQIKPDLIKVRARINKAVRATRSDVLLPDAESDSLPNGAVVTEPTAQAAGPAPPAAAEGGVAQVSLYDCLACSGCVTTSETVLLKEQSVQVFLERLKKARLSVVSFSIQSIAFIAAHFQLKPRVCFRKLCKLLKTRLGVSIVLDTYATDCFLLLQSLREFITLHRTNQARSHVPQQDSTQSQTEQIESGLFTTPEKMRAHRPQCLLTSHCPGWVCYVEKTQSSEVVASISRQKTSQQVLGHFVKSLTLYCYNLLRFRHAYKTFSSRDVRNRFSVISSFPLSCMDSPPNFTQDSTATCLSTSLTSKDVFHATVMPCYDKKLEIHRKENTLVAGSTEEDPIPEVDTVLATLEIFELLEILGVKDLREIEDDGGGIIDDIFLGTSSWGIWDAILPKNLPLDIRALVTENIQTDDVNYLQHPSKACLCCHTPMPTRWNNSSGGFLEYIFRRASQILYNVDIPADEELQMQYIANRDMKKIALSIDGQVRMTFLMAYGFRNIRNIMKLNGPAHGADYVEVMACPQGCLKGGGQKAPGFIPSDIQSEETNIAGFYEDEMDDDVVIEAHAHPLMLLMYRYRLYLEMYCSNKDILLGNYRSIQDEREALGAIGMATLRW